MPEIGSLSRAQYSQGIKRTKPKEERDTGRDGKGWEAEENSQEREAAPHVCPATRNPEGQKHVDA
jgi:hypothetical protein